MARVADYAIVTSGSFSIGSKGSTMDKRFTPKFAANLHAGSRSVLTYVIRDVDVGDVFKVSIKINGNVVDTLSYNGTDFSLDRMVQNVVAANILKPNETNVINFQVQNEVAPGGKVTFSDVVLWYQADT